MIIWGELCKGMSIVISVNYQSSHVEFLINKVITLS